MADLYPNNKVTTRGAWTIEEGNRRLVGGIDGAYKRVYYKGHIVRSTTGNPRSLKNKLRTLTSPLAISVTAAYIVMLFYSSCAHSNSSAQTQPSQKSTLVDKLDKY